MLCGIRGCDNNPIAYWEEPDGQRHYRCRLHQYQQIPQGAFRQDYHVVPDSPAPHQQAPAYRILPEPDA